MPQTTWLAALLCCASFVSAHAAPRLDRARAEMARVQALVDAGAVPKSTLDDAKAELEDAEDTSVLEQNLYGQVSAEDLTEDQSKQMVEAAERQLDRQQAKLDKLKRLVEAGVRPRTDLTSFLEELDSRRRTLDLARSRARLFEELAAMAEAELRQQPEATDSAPVSERYRGDGRFTEADFKRVQVAFEKRFHRPLPVSAKGLTATHRALGFDHRGRVDVAVSPDQQEGVWLRKFLETEKIPYFAFRSAIPGKATAPHIHMGPPSLRLVHAD